MKNVRRLIRGWFTCALHIPGHQKHMHMLTRVIMQLPSIFNILGQASLETSGNLDDFPLQFFKASGKAYAPCQDLKSKIEFK
jgi:hypothetical protein